MALLTSNIHACRRRSEDEYTLKNQQQKSKIKNEISGNPPIG
jgi:hypothetical protein